MFKTHAQTINKCLGVLHQTTYESRIKQKFLFFFLKGQQKKKERINASKLYTTVPLYSQITSHVGSLHDLRIIIIN